MSLSIGSLVGGRYALSRRLGAGGMASVWLAEDSVLGRPVAVKVIADTLAGDPRWLARFEREARAAAAVTHVNVVKIFDYGVEDGSPYLVMEHVPGGNLAERLRAGPIDAWRLARQVLGAIEAVHAAGIVHRDVKPANVLLADDDDVRLTDFGIALPEDATALTQTGVVIGTAQYLAPEVLAGSPATPASDLYAVGMLLRAALGDRRDPQFEPLVDALTDPDPARRPTGRQALAALEDATAATRALPRTQDATAATRAMSRSAPAPARHPRTPPSAPRPPGRSPTPAGDPWPPRSRPRRRGLSPAARNLLTALVAVAVVVVFALAVSGGDGGSGSATPAPADAPLREQLDRLDQLVDEAER